MVVGPKTLAGAIAPSAYKSKELSRVYSAFRLLPSAEQKKREHFESDSRRGYANKNAAKVFEGCGKLFSKSFPRKSPRKTNFVEQFGWWYQIARGSDSSVSVREKEIKQSPLCTKANAKRRA